VGWKKEFQQQIEHLKRALGVQPDLNLMTKLSNPAIPHAALPKKKDVHRRDSAEPGSSAASPHQTSPAATDL
jgi:hypothetical protein